MDGSWDFYCLFTALPQSLVAELGNSHIQLSDGQDIILWNESASGQLTCQSAYKTLYNEARVFPLSRIDWKSKLTNKMKHFLWLAIQDRLLTNSLRYKRRISSFYLCPQCQVAEETVLHVFRYCKCARSVWKEILPSSALDEFDKISDALWFKQNLQGNFESKLNNEVCWPALFTATVWILWKSRKASIFKSKADSLPRILFQIKQMIWI